MTLVPGADRLPFPVPAQKADGPRRSGTHRCERRGWDSNPRAVLPATSLAGRPDRPDSGTSPYAGLQHTGQTPAISNGGRRGIRTPGGFHLDGFQDRCIRPLCHPSARDNSDSVVVGPNGQVGCRMVAGQSTRLRSSVIQSAALSCASATSWRRAWPCSPAAG